jgi:hypothetical protein
MAKKKAKNNKQMKWQNCCGMGDNSNGGSFYGLGFLGALIYYISTAGSFWLGVLGVLKAIVWPVFIVLKILGM